jgi:hypothetical protein
MNGGHVQVLVSAQLMAVLVKIDLIIRVTEEYYTPQATLVVLLVAYMIQVVQTSRLCHHHLRYHRQVVIMNALLEMLVVLIILIFSLVGIVILMLVMNGVILDYVVKVKILADTEVVTTIKNQAGIVQPIRRDRQNAFIFVLMTMLIVVQLVTMSVIKDKLLSVLAIKSNIACKQLVAAGYGLVPGFVLEILLAGIVDAMSKKGQIGVVSKGLVLLIVSLIQVVYLVYMNALRGRVDVLIVIIPKIAKIVTKMIA